jgi:putative tricarboxylic transport membrane protein
MAAVLATVLMAAGCGGGVGAGSVTNLRVMVPTGPGGGYDMTARTAAKVMEEAGVSRNVEVFNLPGAGGTVGLTRLIGEKGNGKLIMQMGLGVVGASYATRSKVKVDQATPLARLIEEPNIVVVPRDSPYTSLQDLIRSWKADPGKVPGGGGSSPGGPDHLATLLIAKAAGIQPKDVNYVTYAGGGEMLGALLGKKIPFGVTGVGETRAQVEAGTIRVLAVTGGARVQGIEAPTLRETGVDVVFTNWRGMLAPPEIGASEEKALVDLMTKIHGTRQWREALAKNGWTDAFLAGDDYAAFLKSETRRTAAVLTELGVG